MRGLYFQNAFLRINNFIPTCRHYFATEESHIGVELRKGKVWGHLVPETEKAR